MTWFLENWVLIVLMVIVLVCSSIFAYKFGIEPSERQMSMIKTWLLYAVIEAEHRYKSGTGKLKLHYCYDLFIEKFGSIAPTMPFEMFSWLVDEALQEMRHILETNKDIEAYVNDD